MAAAAQAAKPKEEHRTVTMVLDRTVSNLEHEFVPAAEAMPEELYTYRPAEGKFKNEKPEFGPAEMRTFAEQVKHVACANFAFASELNDDKPPEGCDKGGPDPATFQGKLSADGASMSGDVAQAGYSIPFTLTRTGDPRIAPVPKNPPIGKELEGTWNGALDLGERQMRLVLRMSNQPDGTATGTIVSPDGSGVEIPIAMRQNGSSLTVDVVSVGASYVGVLNAAGTELAGTWTQGSSGLPLTFTRVAKDKQK